MGLVRFRRLCRFTRFCECVQVLDRTKLYSICEITGKLNDSEGVVPQFTEFLAAGTPNKM